tara:strand:+ start:279 stop:1133 length:855 start_codon:yes stop_codon:yes gene_type:complete
MVNSTSLLKDGIEILKKKGITSHRLDAEILLSTIVKKDRIKLLLNENLKITQKKASAFSNLIKRREKKEPIAYLTQNKEFFSFPFFVDSNSLIPRPETELLVEKILDIYKRKTPKILDIGTGTGCIIISILKNLPKARGLAIDISKNALKIAKINAKKILKKGSINLKFKQNSIQRFSGKREFDIVVSNPPYIPTFQIKTLSEDIKNFEPKLALDGGKDGLDVIKKVIYKSKYILRTNGILALEIGNGQFYSVSLLLKNNFFRIKYLIKDFKNNVRCVISELKN